MLLHATSAILLWLILRRLEIPGAFVASAIFAIHPIQVESVAWITERKNVLAGVFFFASLLNYLKSESIGDPAPATPNDRTKYYLISLALFICGILSKTIAGSMPIEDPEAAGHCLFYCWLAGGIYVGFLERRFRRPSGVVVKEEA